MADNVVANAGSGGATFATDQRASDSVHFPLTKLVWGALDTFTLVDTGAGAIPIADGGNSITIDGSLTNISGTISLPTGASTAAKQPALGTAGTASSDVISVQGISNMTPLLVTPAANSAVNVAQINGVAATMGNGASGTGVQRVTIANDSTGIISPVPATTNGLSYKYFVSAATNNKTSGLDAAHKVYFISVQSIHSAPIYLKMFDATSANVSAGTTACDYQFMCPANSTAANGTGIVMNFDTGIAHANGITALLTTGISSTDNTSTAANIAVVIIGYK